MKKIEAIIRKSRFEDVKKALLAADIEWFSYYNVRGEGKMRQARIYRGDVRYQQHRACAPEHRGSGQECGTNHRSHPGCSTDR